MATKADFTPEEWKSIISAMPMAGIAITAASPSGPIGVMKEMMSIGMAMADVLKSGSTNTLINSIIDDVKQRGTRPEAPQGMTSPEQASTMAIANLQAVGKLVDAKCTPAEAKEFKTWLVSIANKVAEASNEGGFFGFGGERVSQAERTAIANVATALQVSAG